MSYPVSFMKLIADGEYVTHVEDGKKVTIISKKSTNAGETNITHTSPTATLIS